MIAAGRFPGSLLVKALVPTGQLAFTWYVAHIVLGLGGLALLGLVKAVSLAAAVSSALLFFAAAAAVSMAWKRSGRQGPLEWLLRRVAG